MDTVIFSTVVSKKLICDEEYKKVKADIKEYL